MLKITDVKKGDVLVVDGGFDCIRGGKVVKINADKTGKLYFACGSGKHYLDGQIGENDELIGLSRKEKADA